MYKRIMIGVMALSFSWLSGCYVQEQVQRTRYIPRIELPEEEFPPFPSLPPHNTPEIWQVPIISYTGKGRLQKIKEVQVEVREMEAEKKDYRENRRELEDGRVQRFFYYPFKFKVTVRNEMNHVFWLDRKTVIALEDDDHNMYMAKISRSWIAPRRQESFVLAFQLNEKQIRGTKRLLLHFFDLIVFTDDAAKTKTRDHATFEYNISIDEKPIKYKNMDCVVSDDKEISPKLILEKLNLVRPFMYKCVEHIGLNKRAVVSFHVLPNKRFQNLTASGQSRNQESCLKKSIFRMRMPKVEKAVAVRCGISKIQKPDDAISCTQDEDCPMNMFCTLEKEKKYCKEKRLERKKVQEKKIKKAKKVKQVFDSE